MLTDGIRDFMRRNWRGLRERKDAHWADRIAKLGPAEGLRIGDELRAQVLAQDPTWPGPEARAADLAHHVRLAELFRNADPARRG